MGNTSTEAKERFNSKTYDNFHVRIRKDSPISALARECVKNNEFNRLVNSLLEMHFNTVNHIEQCQGRAD
jgi:hypothetical protein